MSDTNFLQALVDNYGSTLQPENVPFDAQLMGYKFWRTPRNEVGMDFHGTE
jgi:hypothetical protein